MHPLESLRQQIDAILRAQPDDDERRCGCVHLYGVAQAAAMLALRRGLDPTLATAAGMLHDIATYHTGEPGQPRPLGGCPGGSGVAAARPDHRWFGQVGAVSTRRGFLTNAPIAPKVCPALVGGL